MDYSALLDLLAENGFQYVEMGEGSKLTSRLSVASKSVDIDDYGIGIYEYESNQAMETDSTYIDSGGCMFSCPGREAKVEYGSSPHFFKKDKIIVFYVGENETILEFLNETLGDEFAGFGYINGDNYTDPY